MFIPVQVLWKKKQNWKKVYNQKWWSEMVKTLYLEITNQSNFKIIVNFILRMKWTTIRFLYLMLIILNYYDEFSWRLLIASPWSYLEKVFQFDTLINFWQFQQKAVKDTIKLPDELEQGLSWAIIPSGRKYLPKWIKLNISEMSSSQNPVHSVFHNFQNIWLSSSDPSWNLIRSRILARNV